jgi:hypothetical protein
MPERNSQRTARVVAGTRMKMQSQNTGQTQARLRVLEVSRSSQALLYVSNVRKGGWEERDEEEG